jgi:hypothetical protein
MDSFYSAPHLLIGVVAFLMVAFLDWKYALVTVLLGSVLSALCVATAHPVSDNATWIAVSSLVISCLGYVKGLERPIQGLLVLLGGFGIYQTFQSPVYSKTRNPLLVQPQPSNRSASPSVEADAERIKQHFLNAFHQNKSGLGGAHRSVNPHSGQTETVQMIPEVDFRRSKIEHEGKQFDGVVARYSYTTQELAQTPANRSATLQETFTDYPPGGYLLEQSRTAKAFVGVVKASIDQYLTPYLKDGAGVNVDLTGWADSLPIGDHLVYKGEYGDLNRIWYYEPNATTPNTLTLPAQSNIRQNEILAIVRSVGVRDYLNSETNLHHITTKKYLHHAVAHRADAGGAYRKVEIQIEIFNPTPSSNPVPSSNPAPDPNPPASNSKGGCWWCQWVDVLNGFGVLGLSGLIGLVIWHHKQAFRKPKQKKEHDFWRNVGFAAFLVLTILMAYCKIYAI